MGSRKIFPVVIGILFACASVCGAQSISPQAFQSRASSVPDNAFKRERGQKLFPFMRMDAPITDEAAQVIEEIFVKAAKANVDGLVLEIDSDGGSLDAGRRISKAIEQAPFEVYCVVDGDGESAAFYILQSCDHRFMTKRSVLMTHAPIFTYKFEYANGVEIGNFFHDAEAQAKATAEQCANRLKIPLKEYQDRTADGKMWFMNWDEALKVGAVDGVVLSLSDVTTQLQKTGQVKPLQLE